MKPIYEVISTVGNDITPETTYIQRTDPDGKVWSIPNDPANSDYQRYLRWLENPDEEQAPIDFILPIE
jgi:hypothetical protein